MTPGVYTLPDFYKNDTFDGVQFEITDTETGLAVDLTGVTIAIEFRASERIGIVAQTLQIGTGVTLTDAPGGIFTIDPFIVTWEPGLYYYDIQVTFLSGVIKTYIEGTVTVKQDITNV